jgi:K+-transporting ATPase c subunit
MIEVADLSQHPRSYEVVSTLINSLSASNKDLLELSEKKKRIEKAENKIDNNNVTNNLFIGSTAELQKLLKGE